MNDANVYAPPETDIRQSGTGSGGDAALRRMNTKEVKKLYNHSRSIGALVFLWSLGLGATILGVIAMSSLKGKALEEGPSSGVLIAIVGVMVAIYGAAVYSCWTRQSWGRVLGIVLCALMLLNFPLGTLIGIFGLIALIGGSRLFGPDRLTHAQLKAEVAYRKANNIR
jgi:hypothetical protein